MVSTILPNLGNTEKAQRSPPASEGLQNKDWVLGTGSNQHLLGDWFPKYGVAGCQQSIASISGIQDFHSKVTPAQQRHTTFARNSAKISR